MTRQHFASSLASRRTAFCLKAVGARDLYLANPLNVRHATVKRLDQLAQVALCARAIPFSGLFLVGH
jgi:hypothetical protein